MNELQQTYYDILEITPAASIEEIQLAFQRAKTTYSQDSQALYTMFSPEEAVELVRLIEEAYTTLSDPVKRQNYDLQYRFDNGVTIEEDTSAPSYNIDFSYDQIFEDEIADQNIFDGSFLQRIREYKNIPLELISETTKIGKHHIVSIESNDFHSLPPTVFVKSFVKQIAECLGINPDKAADSYAQLCKDARGR